MTFQVKKLGDLCEFQGGSQPPKSNFIYEPKDGYIRFLQIRDFGSDKNHTFIPNSPRNKICDADDIMIGRYGASVGKILRGKSGAYNVALMKASPDDSIINKEYFWHYLNSSLFQDDLKVVASRSAQDGFSKDDIFNFQVPLPSLATQKKIVAKLDKIFAEIDKAVWATETNFKNAEALFQSCLRDIYEHGVEDWIERSIGEITVSTKNISPEKSPETFFKYVDVSSVSNVNFEIENFQTLLGKDAPSRAKKHMAKSDVLFATVRPTLKRIAIVNEELDGEVASTGYVVLRANEQTHHKFIFYYLLSSQFIKNMEKLQKGASYPAVLDSDVKNQKIKIPTYENQIKVIEKLDVIFESLFIVKKLSSEKLNQIELLKKSLLRDAFNGNLIKD